MTNNFVQQDVIEFNTELHKIRHRSSPSENVVRLVKWFFKELGHVCDYGCGDGSNMEFLINNGYTVHGVEITANSLERVKNRLSPYSGWKTTLLQPEDGKLPFNDNEFDFILCNQVIYFLGSEEAIKRLLQEFQRILKPKGKMIITAMSRFNDGCTKGKLIGENIYEWKAPSINKNIKIYIFRDENHIKQVINMFNIIEVGYMDNYYCGVGGHRWVILAENLK